MHNAHQLRPHGHRGLFRGHDHHGHNHNSHHFDPDAPPPALCCAPRVDSLLGYSLIHIVLIAGAFLVESRCTIAVREGDWAFLVPFFGLVALGNLLFLRVMFSDPGFVGGEASRELEKKGSYSQLPTHEALEMTSFDGRDHVALQVGSSTASYSSSLSPSAATVSPSSAAVSASPAPVYSSPSSFAAAAAASAAAAAPGAGVSAGVGAAAGSASSSLSSLAAVSSHSDGEHSLVPSKVVLRGAPQTPLVPNVYQIRRAMRERDDFCSSCSLITPVRGKHCYVCGGCVSKFDHHCPFVGNCVGGKNHVRFWWFLAVEECILLWSLFVFIDTFSYSPSEWSSYLVRMALCGFALVWLLVVLSLLSFHSYLALTNQTTLEVVRGQRQAIRRRMMDSQHPDLDNARHHLRGQAPSFDEGWRTNLYYFCFARLKPEWTIAVRYPELPRDEGDDGAAGSVAAGSTEPPGAGGRNAETVGCNPVVLEASLQSCEPPSQIRREAAQLRV